MTLAGATSGGEVRIHGPRHVLDLSGHVLLPGLINAHDHLEFNLFPRMGRRRYLNAGEWARDIYHPDRSPIREHLRVPKAIRLWWGGLKNLLAGVTTVCHHNPYEPTIFGPEFPLRVVRRFAWAHSLEFEPNLAARFRRAPAAYPFLVHAGEGTDTSARHELAELDALGVLNNRTAIIHGVALGPDEIRLLKRRGTALIWCPTSNMSMLGRTLSRTILHSRIPIALGTDSALSAPVDLLDELAIARRYVPLNRLYEMVSSAPASILRLTPHAMLGDWVAFRSEARDPIHALLEARPALVVSRGRIRLIAPELARQLPREVVRHFQPLTLEDRETVLVDADVRTLRKAATQHLGRDLHLAGKRVLS